MDSMLKSSGSPRRRLLFACLAGICFVSCFQFVKNILALKPYACAGISGTGQPVQRHSDKLADGCYHVFLDVGANLGVHGRFLYEPDKYPNATFARSLFDKEFGIERDNTKICVFAFEPNPAHKERHEKMQRIYNKLDWRYTPIMAGASDDEGNLTFYGRRGDGDKEAWGFNAFATNYKGDSAKEAAVTVPVVRLSQWILDNVIGRKIPSYKNSSQEAFNLLPPKVIMKLDVEGMEYRILPDLITSGSYCQIGTIFGEVHFFHHLWPIKTHAKNMSSPKEARTYLNEINKALEYTKLCNTAFIQEDDESYLHDGLPFPGEEE